MTDAVVVQIPTVPYAAIAVHRQGNIQTFRNAAVVALCEDWASDARAFLTI